MAANPNMVMAGSVWEGSPVGKCHSSLEEYLAQIFGQNYASDENIKTIPITSHKNPTNRESYVWAMDTTPTLNFSRTLLRINNSGGRTCAILYIPLASTVSFSLTPTGNLPDIAKSSDTPPPGFASTEIIFRLDRRSGTYAPRQCSKVLTSKQRQTIACDKIHTD
jgi:hypothetical protein